MNQFKKHEKIASDSIATYFNLVSEHILKNNSKEYQELTEENSKLQNKFNVITEIFEYDQFSKDIYSQDELKAIAKYYRNINTLENLERMKIYQIGFYNAIRMISPMEKAMQQIDDDS